MEIINFLAQLETTVQISFAALLISALSFIISLRVNMAKSALSRATKKTEISIKIFETKYIFEKLLCLLNEMSPTQDDCKESIEGMKNDINAQISDSEKLAEKIENAPFIIGATILERHWREAQKLHLRAKELVPNVENISSECIKKHKKAKIYFDSLPQEERSEFKCTIQADRP